MSESQHRSNGGPYLLGMDMGTESIRVGVFEPTGHALAFAAASYRLSHPRGGWAEQDPDEWWSATVHAVREAMDQAGIDADAVAGICADATTCTVVALDDADRPLRPAIMWMDVRAGEQARRIAQSEHPARRYNGGGPVSAEWYPCKALWLKEKDPDVYRRASRLLDCTDWLTLRLTGRSTASVNTASIRGYYNRDEGGWPEDFYEEIGLGDVLEKLPPDVLELGATVEGLSAAAADDLGLNPGTPVAQGAGDAWAAQIGLNVLEPGKMALITGSSHVLTAQTDHPVSGKGFFGAYPGAVVPGQYTVEGGQASTGSVLKWFKDTFCADLVVEAERRDLSPYDLLNERAEALPIGSDGLIVLDYWQGNRTPYTDPDARGIVWGLTLGHNQAHVYRAIQEGVCYGTTHILRVMKEGGFEVTSSVCCGGVTNSRHWTQMHADVTGLPIALTTQGDAAAALGSAVLAAMAAGLYENMQEAAGAMVHESHVVEPDAERHAEYEFFLDSYIDTYPRLRELVHGMASRIGDPPPAGEQTKEDER